MRNSMFVLFAVAAMAAACEPDPAGQGAAGSAKPTTSSPATSAKPAMSPPSAKPAEGAAEQSPPAAQGALVDIDLTPGGASWAGWTMKGLPNAKVASDGASGVSVAMGKYQLTLVQGKANVKDLKAGAKAGADAVKGKVNFTTDTADGLEWATELKDVTGKDTKTFGFAMNVTVEKATIGCSSADVQSPEDLAQAKDICKSINKKK